MVYLLQVVVGVTVVSFSYARREDAEDHASCCRRRGNAACVVTVRPGDPRLENCGRSVGHPACSC